MVKEAPHLLILLNNNKKEVRGVYVKKEITAEVKEMLRELLAEKHEAAAFKRI